MDAVDALVRVLYARACDMPVMSSLTPETWKQ